MDNAHSNNTTNKTNMWNVVVYLPSPLPLPLPFHVNVFLNVNVTINVNVNVNGDVWCCLYVKPIEYMC